LFSHLVRILGPTLPPLVHCWCRVCSVGILVMLGACSPSPCTPGAAFAFVLSRDLSGGPIPTLALSRAFSAPHLLGQDPWWQSHVPAHPFPCTPGVAVPAYPLSCCICSVWILGSGGAVCLLALSCALPVLRCCLSSLAHSWCWDPWWWHHVSVLAPSRALPHLANAKGLQVKESQLASRTHLD
jgi:hypothetical protein